MLKLPDYNAKLRTVALSLAIPLTFVLNSIYFSGQYFSSASFFTLTTVITLAELCLNFMLCGYLAALLQTRFSREDQLILKLGFMITNFVLVSVLMKFFLFKLYEIVPFVNAPLNENRLAWVCLSIAIVNISLTFFIEGVARFQHWKNSIQEGEKLYATYRQSQLNALKSQINPHFLFNSLNTLSSLIEDNEDKAETFLNEMSKVYNYILRSDNTKLVPLESELKFLQSYSYLLYERFGNGLQFRQEISDNDKQKLIAPLMLQVITENAFSQNIVSRNTPLVITISSHGKNMLCISHNLQPKVISGGADNEQGLDTMIHKYQLMGELLTVNDNEAGARHICIPLIEKQGGEA
jgi:two-component system, LytTR family, sensor kinase